MFDAWSWPWLAAVGWGGYFALLVVWIVLQKRGPVATLSWILLLATLPVIGLLVFYFLGPQRLKRFRLRRLRSRAALSTEVASVQRQESPQPLAPGLRALARLGLASSDAPLSSALEARLLVGGQATFDALFADIRQAHHHIHLEYYIFEPDRVGAALRDLLVARARAGVKVRLLIDALGSVVTSRRFLAPLLAAGGQVAFFHDTRIGRRWRPVINYRTHRKIVVIDGRVGYTGGINVTDAGHEAYSDKPFCDVHLRVEGGIVRWLQMVFLEDWVYATDSRRVPATPNLEALFPTCAPGSVQMQVLHSGPNDERESIHRVWVAAIQSAQQRFWLTTPYFVPTEPAMMSLTSAAMRGVDVRVLVPERSDSWLVSAAARSYYDELLAAGVRIWEYRGRLLHAKTWILDDACCAIGTANFDNRSFSLNFEVGTVIYDRAFTDDLADFLVGLQEQSKPVPRPRQRRWDQRLVEATARLWSPML